MKQHTLKISLFLCLFFLIGLCMTACSPGKTLYEPAVAKLIEHAKLLQSQNHLDKAICRLEAAADIAPTFYAVQYNLGVLYSEDNQWSPAIEHLEKATQLDMKQANAFYALGQAYESRADDASPHDISALTSSSDAPSSKKLPAESSAQQKADYQKALAAYQQFLTLASDTDPAKENVKGVVSMLQNKIGQPKTP